MRMRFMLSVLALGLAACSPKTPQPQAEAAPVVEPQSVALQAQDGWAAVTPNGAKVGAGYVTIVNPGEADKLLSASSPRAAKVEIHEMKMDGAMMTMRPVESLDIPAGGSVRFAPGGYHLMFMDITAPFAEGETVPVTLNFEKAGAVDVNLKVGAPAGASGSMDGMKMDGH